MTRVTVSLAVCSTSHWKVILGFQPWTICRLNSFFFSPSSFSLLLKMPSPLSFFLGLKKNLSWTLFSHGTQYFSNVGNIWCSALSVWVNWLKTNDRFHNKLVTGYQCLSAVFQEWIVDVCECTLCSMQCTECTCIEMFKVIKSPFFCYFLHVWSIFSILALTLFLSTCSL